MRILHTSDWHLADRLYWLDRQEDLRKRMEELAAHLDEQQIDVMVVAGDLFSHRNSRMEELRAAVQDVNDVFTPFLKRGGTIVAISGNHDTDGLCGLLCATQELSAPKATNGRNGSHAPGRMYLSMKPDTLLLQDGDGEQVQFVLIPYPTSHRYLPEGENPGSTEEKHRLLQAAVKGEIQRLRASSRLNPKLASVLVAHLHVRGGELHTLYKLSEKEDVIFDVADLPMDWAYSAFGHIHKPQFVGGVSHARYSGSIERMDVGERDDDKSAVVVEIRDGARTGPPYTVPLRATPIYKIEISDPEKEIPVLARKYPDGQEAIVYCTVHYKPGVHNIQEILAALKSHFRRFCKLEAFPEGVPQPSPIPGGTAVPATDARTPEIDLRAAASVPEVVRGFLERRLEAADPDRAELLALAETFMKEVQP